MKLGEFLPQYPNSASIVYQSQAEHGATVPAKVYHQRWFKTVTTSAVKTHSGSEIGYLLAAAK